MSTYFSDNSLSIGNTPLVRLDFPGLELKATVLAKIEGRNPAYSVKCRVGANMIWDAERRGVLKPGVEIIEPTSGNTGIALAFAGAARGWKVNIVMPDSMSLERRMMMKAFGANLILTPGAQGMKGAIDLAAEMAKQEPEKYIMMDQFGNPANPAIHEQTTGPEIWNDTDGNVDVIVSGVGTGGTLTGISRFLKAKAQTQGRKIISVAVEPAESPVITQTLENKPVQPGPHPIQGIGAGFIPKNLDLDLVDRVQTVEGATAMQTARDLAAKQGIICGISSGAATAAALTLAADPEFEGKTIVVILPDSGERYLTTALFEDVVS